MALKPVLTGAVMAVLSAGGASADCSLPADAQNGKMISNQCKSCHVFEAATPSNASSAPNLHDVFGEKAGTQKTYLNYSPAMTAAGAKDLTWTEDKLFEYLADPKAFLAAVTGNPDLKRGMFFSIRDEQKRKDVIAFLKVIKGKPECD